MPDNRETQSRKVLKARFDEILTPLGFRRSFLPWLRNNEETTFGINIQRLPMMESYFINPVDLAVIRSRWRQG